MNSSYVIADASKVRTACEKFLKDRNDRIEARLNEIVSAEMNRRFFKAKTREQALQRRSESVDFAHLRGSYWARQVQDLLLLTSIAADGTVRLNSDDASILREYLNPN